MTFEFPDGASSARPVTLEQHIDGPSGETLGWLARYEKGRALWCGELSRADFKRQPAHVRACLRDDLGWFLVEVEAVRDVSTITVLAKVAFEGCAPDVLRQLLVGRLHEIGISLGDVTSRRVITAPDASVAERCGG